MAEVELQQIGPYHLAELLSASSTGKIYRSKQRNKNVILKRLRRPYSTNEAKEAFLLYTKQLKKLKSRNIIDVLDAGFDNDHAYFVMEYIAGETLRQRITPGQQLTTDEARRYLSHIASALHYAHLNNVLHSNLHLGTIIIDEHNNLHLGSFAPPAQDIEAEAIAYMAPEQLRGAPSSASDQYALASLVYEWLCGQCPFTAASREELVQRQQEPFPAPRELNAAISPAIESVLLQALSIDPAQRYAHAQDFANGYLSALAGFTVRSTPHPIHFTIPTSARITQPQSTSAPSLTSSMPNQQSANAQPEQPVEESRLQVTQEATKRSSAPSMPPSTPKTPIPRSPGIYGASRLQTSVTADLCEGGMLSRSLPGYEERPAQVEMANVVASSLSQSVPAIIEAGTGTGKALDVDTPIPTPSGWKRMGDLAIGDQIFDEHGQPTRVMAAFDVMHHRPCYEVTFSDGSSLIADAEHEWVSYTTFVHDRLAKDLNERRRDKRAYTLVTTEKMAATLTIGSYGRANHAIAVAGTLTLPDADLPIAPYALGIWLGDGSSHSNQTTTADPEMITKIAKDDYTVQSLQNNPYFHAVGDENGKATNLWCNKHIPKTYLRASEQQRRALLAGLLDTNGTVSRDGAIEFTTTSPQLAQDVRELMCSLGFRPTLCEGAHCNEKDCDPKWTLAFTTNKQVFCLAPKMAAHKERLRNYSSERNKFRYVVAVQEVPSRPVRCIQVESQSHLYLAGISMIPTHNSLAYLLPIVRSGKVALISTANKALQEQLFYKDIPFIQQHIQPFEAALVKGVSNYVCLDRVDSERIGIQHFTRNEEFQRLLNIIQDSTDDEESSFDGDFETLGFQLPSDVRSRIATDSDQCAWSKCSFFSGCYVRKMRERAEMAQIIVINHTLLLLDAAIGGFLLPDRDLIVLDEAHHLEEEATRAFTTTISPNRITMLLAQRMLKDHSSVKLQDEALKAAHTAWASLEDAVDLDRKGRANLETPLQDGLKLATAMADLTDSLRRQRPKEMPDKETQLYDKLLKRAQNLAEDIRAVFSVAEPDKRVYYAERVDSGGRGNAHLQVSAAPLDVTSWLKEKLFEKCNVICTSATLATVSPNPLRPTEKGPNFVYFRRRIGLDLVERADVQESILPLTFDYEHNALLYVPRDLPNPTFGDGADDYMKSIAREMYRLVKLSRGRAFLLFSSRRMLDRAYELMAPHLDFPLLKQGEMTRLDLTRRFRQEEGAVLFGLKSFWEGVDIAGDALSLVVIDKLPFDPPDDPVHEARVAHMKAAGEDWFGAYVLPQAVLRLKQGIGRLLRTREDRGVMAILDTRLYTKGYGKMVLRALPPALQTSSLRDVERFFSEEQAF